MSGTPETTYAWRPGQVLRLAASLLLALAKVIERLNPATLLEMVTNRTEHLGERLFAALSDMTLTPLPLFAKQLKGWQVIEDLGTPLPDDWDPRPFLEGLVVGCVHPDGVDYMKGEDLIVEARKRLAGRGGFSQHELDWFYRHWDDERIPDWFRQAVEEEDPEKRIFLVATETVLLNPFGYRYVLYLYWNNGQLDWNFNWLGNGCWLRNDLVLLPGDSSV